MFCVIYSFQVKEGKENNFKEAWAGLTRLIYQHEGSLGSRLHQESEFHYIAYAQWPDRDRWANSGDRLPPEANQFSKAMKDACDKIETLHTMTISDDLLASKVWES